MANTPVCQVSVVGCTRPTFADCLNYVQSSYRAIYGADIYLGADSQDGQFLALLANALHDANGEMLAAYNSFSPATAQGTGLDRNVKLNGIRRKRYSFSTVPMRIVGQVGIEIDSGVVVDVAYNRWALPTTVRIPDAGEVVVLATCQTPGAIQLSVGALDTASGKGSIATVTRGWQSANNFAAASPGLPVESDSQLRQRQAISTALPSQRLQDGLKGALAAVAGVTRLEVYVNNTGLRDINRLPGHAIACVVDGGDPAQIAAVIDLKKGPGLSTYGDTVITVPSVLGKSDDIAFFYLTPAPIGFEVVIERLTNYTPSIEGIWQNALTTFINGLAIGETVERDQALVAAKNFDGLGAKTYRIVSFKLSRVGSDYGTDDVNIGFREAATCSSADIMTTVLPTGTVF